MINHLFTEDSISTLDFNKLDFCMKTELKTQKHYETSLRVRYDSGKLLHFMVNNFKGIKMGNGSIYDNKTISLTLPLGESHKRFISTFVMGNSLESLLVNKIISKFDVDNPWTYKHPPFKKTRRCNITNEKSSLITRFIAFPKDDKADIEKINKMGICNYYGHSM